MSCVEAYRNNLILEGVVNPETGKVELYKGPKKNIREMGEVLYRDKKSGSVSVLHLPQHLVEHTINLNGNGPQEFEISAPPRVQFSSNGHGKRTF